MAAGAYARAVVRDAKELFKRHYKGCWMFIASIIFCMVIIAIVLVSTSLHKISSTQTGILYDKVAKKLGGIKSQGLQSGPPFSTFIKFPSVYVTRESKEKCVSNDGLALGLEVTYQYRINQTRIKDVVLAYRNMKKYDSIMAVAAAASIHWACSQFVIGDFQALRNVVQNTTRQRLQKNVDPLFAYILDVQLRNVAYPAEFVTAVAAKEQASYDIQLAGNERNQSVAKANGNLQLASQQAAIIIQNATTQAIAARTIASNQADSLQFQYTTEAATLRNIQRNLNLTTAGIISYLSNRLIEKSGNRVDVAFGIPGQAAPTTLDIPARRVILWVQEVKPSGLLVRYRSPWTFSQAGLSSDTGGQAIWIAGVAGKGYVASHKDGQELCSMSPTY